MKRTGRNEYRAKNERIKRMKKKSYALKTSQIYELNMICPIVCNKNFMNK
jgi:hypothetical protein